MTPSGRDRVANVLLGAAPVATLALAAAVVTAVSAEGAGHVSWAFLVEAPTDAGRSGGIAPILAATGLAPRFR